jgi:N,N'-diacetyllegionaminate synthase
MKWLQELAHTVGYADQSLVSETGLIASKAALAFGAELIERHFTLLPADETRDGPVSINAEQLRELADFSQLSIKERCSSLDHEYPEWKIVIGKKNRKLSDAELLNRDYYRGRFASPREESASGMRMVNNWEEVPLP